MKNKKYFHELSDNEIKDLLDNHVTIGYIKEHYLQPDWCETNNSLDGSCGCWKLMDLYGGRHDISAKSCEDCAFFKSNSKSILIDAYQANLNKDDKVLFANAFSNIIEELSKFYISKTYIETFNFLGNKELEIYMNLGDKILLSVHISPDYKIDDDLIYSLTIDGEWIRLEEINDIHNMIKDLNRIKFFNNKLNNNG